MSVFLVDNPLLRDDELPAFSAIRPEHVEPAMRAIIADNLARIEVLLAQEAVSWDTLIQPLHSLNDRLEKAWAPVSHMNAVVQDEALRAAHDACLPLLSDYHTRLGQHAGLYRAYRTLRDDEAFVQLSVAHRKVIDNALRDFHLAGIALPAAQQQRYADIVARLSALSSQFANHVLDATRAWCKHVVDETVIAGLPESARETARAQAQARGLDGWLLTLDAPCYVAVMSFAASRALRREVYEAYVTRASDAGPHAGQFDNAPLIDEILALRHELARLLGFDSYADYSLATKMAQSPQQVTDFLWQLVERARPFALQELAELRAFAHDQCGCDDVQSWDVAWFAEKLREQQYAVDQELLRQYFPVDTVLQGLFALVERLFAVTIEAETGVDVWHADVRCFRVLRQGRLIARFYLDLYARAGKRGGAWMGDCRVRRRLDDGSVQLPVAFLTCNFMAPTNALPSLLSFDDVTTLFHEFGHGLHHMLTAVELAPVSGINGVEWDAVELPSQLLENWCWQPQVVISISAHYSSGEPLPTALLDRLLRARNFQSGMQMMRQLEFALFDFLLHWQHEASVSVAALLQSVRERVSVLPPPPFNRFQNSFSHVFAGGYAAGYYSYKWAEVLSADVFAAFEETDIFDDATSRHFLATILERGGTEEAMVLFRRFRARAPQIDALLRHSGLQGEVVA